MPKLTAYSSATTLNEGTLFYIAIDTNSDGSFESRKASLSTIRSALNTSLTEDGASSVAHVLNTPEAYTTAGAKLLSLRNNGVEKVYFDKDGDMYIDSGFSLSGVADGASAEAWVFDTNNEMTTAGAKVASFKNDGTEVFAIDKDGNVTASGTFNGGASRGAYWFSTPSATTLSAATPAKAAGTTGAQGSGATADLTVAATNRITYTGTADKTALIIASLSLVKASGSSSVAQVSIYKNGVPLNGAYTDHTLPDTGEQAVSIHSTASMSENDYFEIWVETDTGDNVTVSGNLSLVELQ